MTVRILVQHMTGVAEDVAFKMADGSYADGNVNDTDITQEGITVTNVPVNAYQLKTYTWAVDTYARFQVPQVLEIIYS